ncbi:hypothetical protein JTE90_019483 [Oedothorax gibbosus]|uniref:Uncharacterized protein n=1 Tax=Oedothorax gibbosus TaxID=931172 RepID=A0AAV6UJF0_9ARAC|nr:hypothetical protein JTE90_019483 [Oedothorax gibbosus]
MAGIMLKPSLIRTLLVLLTYAITYASSKRPFYIIGHQVNSIEEVKEYLDKGSNVLESDIRFYSNGTVKEMLHGPPCECDRNCLLKANLGQYLKHVRDITDPGKGDSYYEKMLVQFFDMKLGDSDNVTESGRSMAQHVLDYLWTEDGSRKQEVRALLYFEGDQIRADQGDVVAGFIDELRLRGKTDRLADVGFDVGSSSLSSIRSILKQLKIDKNVWLGDGDINCKNGVHPYTRLIEESDNRDSIDRLTEKVYAWTIDDENRMRKSLELGVDGMITNVPEKLTKILEEFENFRLGTIEDDPFAYYKPKEA